MFKNSKEENIRDLIGAKFIVDLIENYQNDDNNECEEENEDKLQDLKEKNTDIIKKILDQNDFAKNLEYEKNKKYTYNEILERNIDEIYSDIIRLLIKNNYFSDYNKTKNILEEINFESINLTKDMIKNIKEVLDKNNNYLVNYEIKEINDFNEEKINFYYLLMKYILKNSFFIFNIPFLLQNCLNIIKFKDEYDFKSQKSLKKKINLIIEYFKGLNIDEEDSLINNKSESNQNLDINIYSSNNINISISQENDYQKNIELAKKILNDVTIILMHDKSQEENSLYKIKDIISDEESLFNNSIDITREEHLNSILTNIEKEKKDKKDIIYKNFKLLLNFINDIKDYIAKNDLYFKPDIYLDLKKVSNNNNNNNIILVIDDFTDTSDKNKDVYDITCTSSFEVENKENKENGKTKKYKFNDFNVLINGIDEEPLGFVHLINELTNSDYKILETE